jgi:hypothetical protein
MDAVMGRSGTSSRRATLESVALVASCLLLLWLNRGERGPEPLTGALAGPKVSFLVAIVVAWLVPGYVLCRLAGGPWRGNGLQMLALSLGAGLAWLALPATIVLVAGGGMEALAGSVAALNGALVLAHLGFRLRPSRAIAPPPEAPPPLPSPWLAGAAALALGRLLVVSARWPRFTFGGDEWILMRSIRYFLEVKPIAATWDFDVWDLLIALFIRLADVDLLDAYRVYLPPILIVAASVAFLALAEVLFRDRNAACFSYVVLAVYALSDMQTRGDGAGMGLIVRLAEDKYAALFLAVPAAQTAFLAFLRGGPPALVAVAAAIALAAIVVYPLSIVWLLLSAGATCLAALAAGRIRVPPRVVAALTLTLVAAVGVAWWLRSLRVASYFLLYDPEWPFGEVLRNFTRRQLLILSRDDGWYMAHPALLRHPLMVAGVLAALCLLPRLRVSLKAQFLVCSTFLPLLLAYNPVTARLLGAWVTPWMVPRVPWMVPVALTLGYLLHRALQRAQGSLGGGARAAPARGRYALLWVAAIGFMVTALGARMAESWRALKARNRVAVAAGERELMQALSRDARLAGQVLAPWGIGIRLPAWTSRLQPYPGLDDMRWNDPVRLKDWRAFYEASAVGETEAGLLRSRGIEYVITRTGTPIDQAIRALPGPFKTVYAGPSFSLYDWRPERWAAAPVTSFDTSGRNLAAPPP